MRIIHVVLSSRIAGSERYCLDLANRQAELGHEVHVVGARHSPVQFALDPAVQFHGFGRLFRGFFIRRFFSRMQPDVCHGHLSAACKILRTVAVEYPTVATLHVGYKPHQHDGLGGLICVNRAQAARLSDYEGLVRTVANWLPTMPAAGAGGIREELGLAAGTFVVGAVGRLHSSKGNDVLIEAFRAAAPADAALVIVGEGPQRPVLEKLCAGDPRIHLAGYRPCVGGCLHDLDLFVSPSREESFGLAIVEAMSTGVPIIATEAEGPAEFLRDQPAVLVPAGSVPPLAAAIRAAAERFHAGQLARPAYDLTPFDSGARVANIMDFYSQVRHAQQMARLAPRQVTVAT